MILDGTKMKCTFLAFVRADRCDAMANFSFGISYNYIKNGAIENHRNLRYFTLKAIHTIAATLEGIDYIFSCQFPRV